MARAYASANLSRVSGYRTQSADTDRRSEELLFALYRQLTPAQRISRVWELNAATLSRARVGIRQRHPRASEEEIELRIAALKYGREFTLKYCGWDPDVHGW